MIGWGAWCREVAEVRVVMESVLPPCRRTRRQRLTPAEPALPLQVLEEWVLLTAVIAARNTATNESNSRTEHCIPRYH